MMKKVLSLMAKISVDRNCIVSSTQDAINANVLGRNISIQKRGAYTQLSKIIVLVDNRVVAQVYFDDVTRYDRNLFNKYFFEILKSSYSNSKESQIDAEVWFEENF